MRYSVCWTLLGFDLYLEELDMKLKETIKDYAIITFGVMVIVVAVYFFIVPSQLSLGSITGLAILINHLIPVPVSVITLTFNVGLLILGTLPIGREFGAKTIYASIILPIMIGILEMLVPNVQSITGSPFQDMICYLFIVSAGQAILFARNASSGGLDIVGKIINKYTCMELGSAIALVGMCVAVASVFIYDLRTMVLSVLGTYLNGIVLDHFIFGMDKKRRVCILSSKLDEIRDFIIHDLHSGATLYESVGAYNYTPQKEIIAIVDKNEYSKLMTFISKTDPKAFVTVYAVSEVSYVPKPRH